MGQASKSYPNRELGKALGPYQDVKSCVMEESPHTGDYPALFSTPLDSRPSRSVSRQILPLAVGISLLAPAAPSVYNPSAGLDFSRWAMLTLDPILVQDGAGPEEGKHCPIRYLPPQKILHYLQTRGNCYPLIKEMSCFYRPKDSGKLGAQSY